jgi:hypothetical protein
MSTVSSGTERQMLSSATSNATTNESVRLKSNRKRLRPVLDDVLMLQVETFDKKGVHVDEYGEESISPERATPSIGLIAQGVRDIFPEIVVGDETEGYLSLQDRRISGIRF